MSLEESRTTRDYLYGRLLAIADRLEGLALLYSSGEDRETNAARYMQRFAERPFSTWRMIRLALRPYEARLRSSYLKDLLDEVTCKFQNDDFINDDKLTGEFLLGFHCQRAKLCEKKPKPPDQTPNAQTVEDKEK